MGGKLLREIVKQYVPGKSQFTQVNCADPRTLVKKSVSDVPVVLCPLR